MVRDAFNTQILNLRREVIALGGLCDEALDKVQQTMDSRAEHGEQAWLLAEDIKNLYRKIEDKEHEIENLCITLLVKQQPVAGDLRQISSALKIVHDCKRIGDQSMNAGEILAAGKYTAGEPRADLRTMAARTRELVAFCLKAYAQGDLKMAREADELDDAIDELFARMKQELAAAMKESGDGEQVLGSLLVAKYFEKIGDHAVHIAKWVDFSLTGNKVEG